MKGGNIYLNGNIQFECRLELPIIGHAELKMQEYIHLGQIKKLERNI
jgi:hypothetical protein